MSAPAIDAPDALSRLIPSRVARGFAIAVVSGLFFTGLNASVKELAGEMPPLFVSWGRWIAGLVVIVPILLWRSGIRGLATRDLKLHCFRGLFHTGGYGLWYEAVVWLPLATMAALGFTGPIFVTLGAALFLGERVQARRWLAVAVGFVGMLVIARPGMTEMNPGIWMMLAAIPLIAGSNLVAKAVSGRDLPALVVFWQTVIASAVLHAVRPVVLADAEPGPARPVRGSGRVRHPGLLLHHLVVSAARHFRPAARQLHRHRLGRLDGRGGLGQDL